MSAPRLAGKVAFITGAARGQGRSHAIRLAEEGADIIAVDVCGPLPTVDYPLASPADLAETVRRVEELDRRIVARQADVRSLTSLEAALTAGVAELGRLDIVAANAGILSSGSLAELSVQAWREMIDVNLSGVWRTCRAAIPHLIAGGRGGPILSAPPGRTSRRPPRPPGCCPWTGWSPPTSAVRCCSSLPRTPGTSRVSPCPWTPAR